MKKIAALVTLLAATALQAGSLTFDFKDPKGVNNAVFQLDAPLESINGTANGVSGTVEFDPANPTATKGRIAVLTKSLTVPNPMMNEHLLGEKWLNAKAHPEITFEMTSAKAQAAAGSAGSGDVTGTFTLNGVSKKITVPVKFSYLPGKLSDRTGGKMEGDLLVIRTNFRIKRSDFAIQAGQNLDKVSDEIAVSLAIAGAAPKK